MREVIDLLLRDVGVQHEKHEMGVTGWGWFGWKARLKGWFAPYDPVHHRGLWESFWRLL
jgi:hypothetical protein